MAFSDPQSVTINAVANSLPRVSSGVRSGQFAKDDGNIVLTVDHAPSKGRVRRTVRIDHRKVAADPLMAGANRQYSMSAYLVVNVPDVGYSIAEQKQIVDGLTAYLTASTGARVTQLLGGEN